MTALTPAPSGYPIKLIRDNTTDVIGDKGILFYDHIPEAERPMWLKRKLIEEAVEYLESGEIGELADVLAVVEGLAVTHDGITLDELIAVMHSDPRGGFLTGRMMRGYHPKFDGDGAEEPA